MWLLKLPLKIIALPVMAVVAVLSIFYSIALHLSSLVVGLGYLFLGVCIVVLLFQQMWGDGSGLVWHCGHCFSGSDACGTGFHGLGSPGWYAVGIHFFHGDW